MDGQGADGTSQEEQHTGQRAEAPNARGEVPGASMCDSGGEYCQQGRTLKLLFSRVLGSHHIACMTDH